MTPTTEVIGSCQWWIQTYKMQVLVPGASRMVVYHSNAAPPPQPLWCHPRGPITDTTPTYTWNAVSNATWYYLYVNDSTGNKIQQWYTAAEVGCASGTGTCSVTPSTVLATGAGQWWIQTYNSAGYGPWSSSGMTFTVISGTPPLAATLVSPSGTDHGYHTDLHLECSLYCHVVLPLGQ